MNQATFNLRSHNPDVLSCIANLSNDAVFTPPEFANEMLDSLEKQWQKNNAGSNIWADKDVTFLDPSTKSGVYLREIVRRLNRGLTREIPDLTERINHILTNQVFGIATERLTSLLSRRSVYCSKKANGIHSIARTFDNEEGNIWFERIQHNWHRGSCTFCGGSESEYSRGDELETHAYFFTHTDDIKNQLADVFGENMRFDVIIGNPPYQLSDGGASASARPIYQQFIEQAMNLDPRYLVMVTPSRWFAGGKGLDAFRKRMLADKRIRIIVDYVQEKDAFPNVNINGGVNYFLWDRDHVGDCEVTTVAPGGKRGATLTRPLGNFDIFIRRNEALPILKHVMEKHENSFSERVSSRKPFGLPPDFHGVSRKTAKRDIKFYGSGKISWVSLDDLEVNAGWVKKWKVLIPRATDGNENYPLPIWDHAGPFIAGPGEACSETYLVASLAKSKTEAQFIVNYMRTKFFRFMISLRKSTQDNKASIFAFVPDLPYDHDWTDAELFKRYALSKDDVVFVESMIREMKFTNE
jgi:site-specific DNA-methyltransferase (adenine-specific)